MSVQNIVVAARVRPLSQDEETKGCTKIANVNIQSNSISITSGSAKSKSFSFDHCYDEVVTQERVYEDIGVPALSKTLDGYNSTIFAYGPIGSGKTFSIMGEESNPGLIPRVVKDLFRKIDQRLQQPKETGSDINYMVSISFLEVCDENIIDLLNPSDKSLRIRESTTEGVFVEGLCEVIVRNYDDVIRLIEQGNTMKLVTATNIGKQSLCSHTCFIVTIEEKTTVKLDGGMNRVVLVKSNLNLVDLGGSKKTDSKEGTKGDTSRKGIETNSSLMALENVINALAEVSTTKKNASNKIPYKYSELTRLLQQSLGGNSNTFMIATLSPADYSHNESKSTLKYANRVKSIENRVVKNEGKVETMADRESTWEERGKESLSFEDERKSNLYIAMTNVLHDVKLWKITKMIAIKKMTSEKDTRLKLQQTMREQSKKLGNDVEILKTECRELEVELKQAQKNGGDSLESEKARIESEMNHMKEDMDSKKEELLHIQLGLQGQDNRLKILENEMIDRIAELEEASTLLKQNDMVRKKILTEQSERAKAKLEGELEEQREKTKDAENDVRNDVERQFSAEIGKLKGQIICQKAVIEEKEKEMMTLRSENDHYVHYVDTIENKLMDAEAQLEAAQHEMEALKGINSRSTQMPVSISDLTRKESSGAGIEMSGLDIDEIRYSIFSNMMDEFEVERDENDRKLKQLQQVIKSATTDILHLSQENQYLRNKIHNATINEKRIVPSDSIDFK